MPNLLKIGVVPGGTSVNEKTLEYEYTLTFDSPPTMDEYGRFDTAEVFAAPGVPLMGSLLPTNPLCYVSGISAKDEENNPRVWRVTVTYSIDEVADNPENDEPMTDVAYDFQPRAKTYNVVATGAYERYTSKTGVYEYGEDNGATASIPITNTAGDPFDTPLMFQEKTLLISWWQIEHSGFDPVKALEYIDTLNEKKILVAGITVQPKCGRILNIEPNIYWPKDEAVPKARWKTTYTIEIKKSEWYEKVISQGYNANFPNSSGNDNDLKKRRIYKHDVIKGDGRIMAGDPIDYPVWLDEKGKIAGSGASPVVLWYRTIKTLDWAAVLKMAQVRYTGGAV